MKRKLSKIVIFLFCVVLFFGLFYWDTWKANTITYQEFEQKIYAQNFEKIVVNIKRNNVLLYEKETNQIYKMELVSKDKIEEMVWEAKKTNGDIIYKVNNKKMGVLSFLIYINACFLIIKVLGYFTRKINFFKSIDDIKRSLENKKDSLEKERDEKKKKSEEALDELKNAIKSINGETFEVKKETDTKVTFKDVIGLNRELEELKDIVSFLKESEKYRNMGADLPRGILLYGKSGVGKTLIARAIAGEAKVPFFQVSASAFQSKYVGGTEENIRKLFKEAKAEAPSIIFIDEFDSVALRRYGKHSNEYSVSFLNQLLACMDGFERMDGVLVIAATNHYEQLDEAVLRRGRFDRHICIHEPDKKAREELIKYYACGKSIELDESMVKKLLPKTVGFTGSDIKTLMNEAAILAVRNGRECIEYDDLEEAYRKIMMGSRSSREDTLNNKRRTAVHEAGHALVALSFGKKVMEVSIVPRGNAAGYSLSEWDEEQEVTPEEIINRIQIVLAGRAAEKVVYDNVSAGAADDMRKATNFLCDMKIKYGMNTFSDVYPVLTGNTDFDKELATQLVKNVELDLSLYYGYVLTFLKANEEMIKKMAELLCEKEVLTEEDIKAFMNESGFKQENISEA